MKNQNHPRINKMTNPNNNNNKKKRTRTRTRSRVHRLATTVAATATAAAFLLSSSSMDCNGGTIICSLGVGVAALSPSSSSPPSSSSYGSLVPSPSPHSVSSFIPCTSTIHTNYKKHDRSSSTRCTTSTSLSSTRSSSSSSSTSTHTNGSTSASSSASTSSTSIGANTVQRHSQHSITKCQYQNDNDVVVSPSSPFHNKTFDILSSNANGSSSSSTATTTTTSKLYTEPSAATATFTKNGDPQLSHQSKYNTQTQFIDIDQNNAMKTVQMQKESTSKGKSNNNNKSTKSKTSTTTAESAAAIAMNKKKQIMISSIKNALNHKLNDYESEFIHSSSRKYAVSPKPPTLPLKQKKETLTTPKYYTTNRAGNVNANVNTNKNNKNNNKSNFSNWIYNQQQKKKQHAQNQKQKKQKQKNANLKITAMKQIQTQTQSQKRPHRSRKQLASAIRDLWKKRNARSIEEGIRRTEMDNQELSSSSRQEQLSNLLQDDNYYNLLDESNNNGEGYTIDANGDLVLNDESQNNKKRYIARTISGLISAIAEEATGLDVEVISRDDTPLWQKRVDKLSIQFERLGIKQLKMGGLDEALQEMSHDMSDLSDDEELPLSFMTSEDGVNTVDDIFDRIDVDKSGALDEEELTRALTIASGVPALKEKSMAALGRLAERLLRLYDTNGDGVVDRDEYQKLVSDMTAVRDAQRLKQKVREETKKQRSVIRKGRFNPLRWGRVVRRTIFRARNDLGKKKVKQPELVMQMNEEKENEFIDNPLLEIEDDEEISNENSGVNFEGAEDISNDPKVLNAMTKGEGSIVMENLKLDLRRLIFGVFPVLKKITPGGPLILEPFTFTITGSFNRADILESVLLDDGLRRLVARALRRRVRSIRDLVDGAVFYGRTWNMASKEAPLVEVPKLTNIEFDHKDRLIITGKAIVRTSPDQPFVENSFKLRTKLGTRENGQYIRLEEPELALIIECPKNMERNIVSLCKTFKLPVPNRPEPIEQFIPLVSPIKKTEDDGFNLGDDNRIKSIFIKDNALRFEISAVLRPGRFLGNHYLAFTIPNRTFIITMDRIREGIRNARENKRQLRKLELSREREEKKQQSERYNRAVAQALSKSNDLQGGQDIDLSYQKEFTKEEDLSFLDPKAENNSLEDEVIPNKRGFFGRFLEGYLDAAREESEKERNERLTTAISEFFSSGEESKLMTVIDSNGKVKQRAIV